MITLRLPIQNPIFLLLLLIINIARFRLLFMEIRAEDDTACLLQFQKSVKDPQNYLANWIFTNVSKGSICTFTGVQCWSDLENKVLNLKLPQAGLSGSFPSGLSNCASLTGLDLSGNQFSGPIPSNICQQLHFLTSLDLSQNRFWGPIPDNLGNCSFLNALHLQQNQLSGPIPWSVGMLRRLTDLDLSSNSLSGPIPSSFTNRTAISLQPFTSSSFQNNPNLCGLPLSSSCRTQPSHVLFYMLLTIAGATVATAAVLLQIVVWWRFCAYLHRKQSISQP